MFAVLLFWLGSHKAIANAAEGISGEGAFDIEADLLPGGDENIYNIRVTVLNGGADWEGTVRLTIENRYYSTCAYDTALSLPEGSKKQFMVKIPADSMEDRRGTAYVQLLDKRGNQVGEREYARFLDNTSNVLSMGILSDDYAGLTYLDMGGQEMYYYDDMYPVKLVELSRDNLEDYLDSIVILVIDHYSTEVLTEEQMQAVLSWNVDGGVLIIGTGAYAEDTLGGFDSDYLGVESHGVYSSGNQGSSGENQGASSSGKVQAIAQQYGLEFFMDTEKLTLADLTATLLDAQITKSSGGYVRQVGLGAVGVLAYSLSELGNADAQFFYGQGRTDFILNMLDELSNYSQTRYGGSSNYYDYEYYRNRLFGILGNGDNVLNFGVLRVIVIFYVIFVGPVLYLVLKLLKKRELYWVAVPVCAVFGIALIYMAGRGFKVTDTKVYSVTVENLAASGGKRSYMQCYDAGHSEWQLKLADDYEYAGPMDSGYYYGGANYYYHVRKDGDELYFGINPEASFENCRFVAGIAKGADVSGQQSGIKLQNIEVHGQGTGRQELSGTVRNDTGKDFSCFAMIVDDCMYVYESLPAGESRELADMVLLDYAPPIYEDHGDYVRHLRSYIERDMYEEKINALAALGIGICGAADEAVNSDIFFMGVTEDYERVVDDVCDEVSYGCFYAVE